MRGDARVHRLTVSGVALVAKSARGGSRQHLRREAELLEHLRGLPVVELMALRDSDDRTDLVTIDAGERDLSRLDGLSPEQILRALADAAAAVAELHAAGWTHGALCAQHVVVSGDGAVRLCSLGSAAVRCDSQGELGPAARSDVQQLVATIDRVLPELHHDPGVIADRTPERHREREAEFRSIWNGLELRNDRIRSVVPITFRPLDDSIRDCVESLIAVAGVEVSRRSS